MQTIVVATDFSAEASNAMEYAAALARNIKARIILFNSFQLPEEENPSLFSAAEIDKKLNENRKYLQEVAAKVSERHKIRVDYWTNLTYVAEGLEELVDRSNADLVVMGMWKNAREDMLFGNTTTNVIQQAKFPVLVVPEGVMFMGIDKILFSWEPEVLDTLGSLKLLKYIAFRFNAQVQAFHVTKQLELAGNITELQKESLAHALTGVQYYYRKKEEEDVLLAIERGVKEYEADLLIMVAHKPVSTKSYFYESTCEMALRTIVPLLVLLSVK